MMMMMMMMMIMMMMMRRRRKRIVKITNSNSSSFAVLSYTHNRFNSLSTRLFVRLMGSAEEASFPLLNSPVLMF